MDAQAEEKRNCEGLTWEEWAAAARIHHFLRESNAKRIQRARYCWETGEDPTEWLLAENKKYATRWFKLGPLLPYFQLRPMEPGENHGWGDRFRVLMYHHPEGYTAGFNNPSFGIDIELRGWQFSLGAEY